MHIGVVGVLCKAWLLCVVAVQKRLNQLIYYIMNKNFVSVESYEAPEMEVVATVVEYGFQYSSVIDDVDEEDFGEF